MFFQELDKLKRNIIMSSIVLMFVGVILMIIPMSYIPFLADAVGFILAVFAVYCILRFLDNEKVLMHYIRLCLGLFVGVFGISLWVFDGLFMLLVSYLVGTLPIIAGAYGIFHSIAYARRSGRRGWWVLILFSLAMMLFGGLVFFNPWMESQQAMIQVMGGTMLSTAFVSALRLIWAWPLKENNGGAQ